MKKLVMCVLIAFLMLGCSNVKPIVGVGYQSGSFPYVGPKIEDTTLIGTVGLTKKYQLGETNFSFNPEAELVAINQNGTAVGASANGIFGYSLTKNISLQLGGGFGVLDGHEDFDGLGDSNFMGTIKAFVKYKSVKVGIDHRSLVDQGGEVGDLGLNLLKLEIEF